MSQKKLSVASTEDNLRLCIIENAIYIEHTISQLIGDLLQINPENSKSFGSASSSLSFNQKVNIILDIKGINRENLKKLVCLANIRNKFAHVLSIEKFSDLFDSATVGKEIKINLDKWYLEPKPELNGMNIELIYRLCFYLLVNDIIEFLLNLFKEHMYSLGWTDGEKQFKDEYVKVLNEEIKTLGVTPDFFQRVFKKIEDRHSK